MKLLGSLLLLLLAMLPTRVEAQQRRPPNVIVIVADDLGVQDISPYGHRSAVPTPNLERLARRGVTFQRGYATAPLCSPSRAALLSGQYQQRHGFEFLIPERHNEGGGALGLGPNQRLLPEALQRRGYVTAGIGKWHLGDTPDRLPTARGFRSFVGFLPGEIAYIDKGHPDAITLPAPYVGERSTTRRLDYTNVYRWSAGAAGQQRVDNADRYLTDELTTEALQVIRGNRRRPYFLYLAHLAPHSPFQTTRQRLERTPNQSTPLRRVYASMVTALDESVGQILDAVEASGQADNTIIVFTSDNGAATYMNVSACDGQLAGGKLSMFEGGVRVPLIISWPARWPQGKIERRNASLLDIYPTVAAAAGVKEARPTDGVDLTPFVAGAQSSAVMHENLFWRSGHEFAVLSGDNKLISNSRPGAFPWLFDLAADPAETNTLMHAKAPLARELMGRYRAWAAQMQEPAWPSKETLQVFQCGRISYNDQ